MTSTSNHHQTGNGYKERGAAIDVGPAQSTTSLVRVADTVFGGDYEKFLASHNGEHELARTAAQARDTYLRSRQRELDLAIRTGNLVSVGTLLQIRDETIQAINNILGPALSRSLSQYGVPETEITRIRNSFYSTTVEIWHKAGEGD